MFTNITSIHPLILVLSYLQLQTDSGQREAYNRNYQRTQSEMTIIAAPSPTELGAKWKQFKLAEAGERLNVIDKHISPTLSIADG